MKRIGGPLAHAPFRFLLAGRIISGLGNAVAPIALAFAVLDMTGSPRSLSFVVGARTMTNVGFLLFGGVLADRLPRHLLMVGTNIAAGLTQAAVAATLLTGTATVGILVVLSAANGLFSALAMPASAALMPQTVPEGERQRANALSRLFLNGTTVVGAAAGGALVAVVGPAYGIAVDAGSFLVAAVSLAFVRVPRARAAEPGNGGILADLRVGWNEFSSRTWLWAVVAGFGIINACLGAELTVLGPVVADATFGRASWGLVLAAETVGMIAGGFVAMRVRTRRLLLFGVVCMSFQALPIAVLGLAPYLVPLICATVIAGLAIEQFGVAWETTVQQQVPAEKLARVYSYDMLGSFVAIPVGQVLAGPIAQVAGVRPTLIGTALLLLAAVAGMVSVRDVRQMRHQIAADDATVSAAP